MLFFLFKTCRVLLLGPFTLHLILLICIYDLNFLLHLENKNNVHCLAFPPLPGQLRIVHFFTASLYAVMELLRGMD